MLTRLANIAIELGISKEILAARNLPIYPEAEQLEIAELGTNGREYLLISPAADAWRTLKTAARDNVSLFIISTYRSVDRQAEIIRRKLDAGANIEDILTLLAPPGYSEHHTGCAIDISTLGFPPATTAFEQSAAFAWLSVHAHHFDFYLSFPPDNPEGYQYEPWHWCFHITHA